MTFPFRLENQAEVQPVQGPRLHEYLLPDARVLESGVLVKLSTAELAFRIFAAFRAHPHVNNVLTHISRAKWVEVEKSLRRILDLSPTSDGLSPLEENILELMAGERGISGKILKPYFVACLHRMLGPSQAERLIRHVNALYLDFEWKVQRPPSPAPARTEALEESEDARGDWQ